MALLYCSAMLSAKSRSGRARRPRTAAGERIYAIGDIHGRYDLLRDLLRKIETFDKGRPSPEKLHVVLLGDVVDRGPGSAQLLRYLKDWSDNTQGQVMLLGNHEEMMVRVHAGERRLLHNWLQVGGRETLESFGLTPPPNDEMPDLRFMDEIAQALPRDLMDFVRKWPTVCRSGDYFFCHAGVKPGVDLTRQSKTDLIWIRNEFLNSSRDHGAVVVHGHSISAEAEVRSNRIGIDTGAYRTGVLTALYLEGAERELIATPRIETEIAAENPAETGPVDA